PVKAISARLLKSIPGLFDNSNTDLSRDKICSAYLRSVISCKEPIIRTTFWSAFRMIKALSNTWLYVQSILEKRYYSFQNFLLAFLKAKRILFLIRLRSSG